MKFEDLLAKHKRIAIVGPPRCGKTTLSGQAKDRLIVHTDKRPADMAAEDVPADERYTDGFTWDEVPIAVRAFTAGRDAFCVEGCLAIHALRSGLEVDAVVLTSIPKVVQTDEQANMGLGIATVYGEWRDANALVPVYPECELEGMSAATSSTDAVDGWTLTLDKATVEPTRDGVRYRARFSKVCVNTYRNSRETDTEQWAPKYGPRRREYRSADEVGNPASVATLKGKTICVMHPVEGEVNTNNFRRVSVGHVEDPVFETDAVYGWAYIKDGATIRRIDLGELVDLSPGYDHERIEQAGEWNGEEYQFVQSNIVYDHVALLPPGAGRQNQGGGEDVALILDSVDSSDVGTEPNRGTDPMADPVVAPVEEKKPAAVADALPPGGATEEAKLTPEDVAALKQLAGAAPKIMQLVAGQSTDGATPTVVVDAAKDGKDAAADKAKDGVEPEKKAMDAADIDARISRTADIRNEHKVVLGEKAVTKIGNRSKTNRELMVEVVKSVDAKDLGDGIEKVSDSELEGRYRGALALHARISEDAESMGNLRPITRRSNDAATPAPRKMIGHQAYGAFRAKPAAR